MHDILTNNVTPAADKALNLIIYYKSRKIQNLIMRNCLYDKPNDARVVYQYSCGPCSGASYIGYTTCSLRKRFYMHVQSGSISDHVNSIHKTKPTSKTLLESTKIIFRTPIKTDLLIAEALLIREMVPELNRQEEGADRVLKIF